MNKITYTREDFERECRLLGVPPDEARKVKNVQPAEDVLVSVWNLRRELLESCINTPDNRVFLWKLNSCLFSQYPHDFQKIETNPCAEVQLPPLDGEG